MPVALEQQDKARDASFSKAMHRSSARTGAFAAMFAKDNKAHNAAVDEYFKFWEEGQGNAKMGEEDSEERRAHYATLTRQYYNLATDLYESGWSTSFHFCRFYPGEGFLQAIARHEHYLAHKMGIKENSTVLDVGCGIGGPAREICRFTDCNIVGLNNNDYQIERAMWHTENAGLTPKMKYVKGDFMQMDFEPNTFDYVYAIEATVHAPSLEGIYGQIYNVLKPGGVFGVYEWLMTENYDPTNPTHKQICHGIEVGNGISNMVKISEALRAMKAVGFELEFAEDLATRPDTVPWYYPLAGELKYARSLYDLFTVLRITKLGQTVVHNFVGLMEMIGIAPKGTQKTADNLSVAAANLVAGAKEGIFTPMYLMIARKPLNAN
ncbi:S-adenosyl-L-methionine-dependent methyltransferase [Kalaharituber pfeilii]|nr:S-adenosyl-L-methionine-dependent methyltransferase [Kalaharituber pfeilii]